MSPLLSASPMGRKFSGYKSQKKLLSPQAWGGEIRDSAHLTSSLVILIPCEKEGYRSHCQDKRKK